MSINVNVGNIIPTNVVEVGNEISVDQLAAITAADSPSAINPFATASHLHTIANISGLQTAIDGKANLSHTHVITNITGLQNALDGKAPSNHLHEISGVTGLLDALDGKANLSHTHVISDVTGLQTALDGKLSASHNHDGVYAPVNHTHSEYALLTGATFSGNVIRDNGLGQSILGPASLSFSQTGGGGSFVDYGSTRITFADTSIQDTASYSKAQSDAQIATVGTWINTKADLGHTHVINDVTGLQTALDSKMAVTQSWIEGVDIGRTFTITDGVLNWDNASTLSHPMSGGNAGSFVFNKNVVFTPVLGKAGLNIGIGGTDTASNKSGDVWISTGGTHLNYRDATGAWRIVLTTNQTYTISAPQVIDTTSNTLPAMRITQKGTGNAFVVEDSTTPDSTPFIINAIGQTLIGRTTAPNSSVGLSVANGIHVESGTGTTTAIQIIGNIDASSQQTNANTTSISSEYTEEWQVIINGNLAYIPFRR